MAPAIRGLRGRTVLVAEDQWFVADDLAALDHVVDFATTFGADPHGERIRTHLADRGVHVLPGSETDDPTSTARAERDEAGGGRGERR